MKKKRYPITEKEEDSRADSIPGQILMANKSTTLSEVALAANVSPMTASRAINNRSGVSRETREHVLKVAADLGYVVKVGDLKPVSLDISVKDFTIVSYKRVSAGLRFRVAAGAWKSGTIIELTRDGAPVSKIEVTSPGAEVILFSPDQPGFYQVQVSTSRGVVYVLEVQPVL